MTSWTSHDGSVTLYNADCLEVLPTLGKVDAVVTDPPYGIGAINQGGGRPEHMKDTLIWDLKPVDHDLLSRIISVAPVSAIWGGNYFDLPPSRCWLTWVKPDAVPSMSSVEYAWTNLDKNSKHIIHSIAATNAERVQHPTQKPIRVMKWCMDVTGIQGTVLDPFMGSGTTGVACVRTGRKFIGIEIDPTYYEIAVKRIDAECRQGKLTFAD